MPQLADGTRGAQRRVKLKGQLGAVADIKGGSGILKLGGGPITMKGSKVAIKSPMVIKMGTSLKEG